MEIKLHELKDIKRGELIKVESKGVPGEYYYISVQHIYIPYSTERGTIGIRTNLVISPSHRFYTGTTQTLEVSLRSWRIERAEKNCIEEIEEAVPNLSSKYQIYRQ